MRSWTSHSADLTRRGALAGLASAGAAVLSGCVSMRGGPPLPVASLAIDVSGLKAGGLGPYADMVGAELARAASASFVPGPGPRIVLAVSRLQWGSEPDAEDHGGGAAADFAEGHVEIADARGLRRLPLLVSRARRYDPVWTPEGERRRVFEMMEVFAGWARVEVARTS